SRCRTLALGDQPLHLGVPLARGLGDLRLGDEISGVFTGSSGADQPGTLLNDRPAATQGVIGPAQLHRNIVERVGLPRLVDPHSDRARAGLALGADLLEELRRLPRPDSVTPP